MDIHHEIRHTNHETHPYETVHPPGSHGLPPWAAAMGCRCRARAWAPKSRRPSDGACACGWAPWARRSATAAKWIPDLRRSHVLWLVVVGGSGWLVVEWWLSGGPWLILDGYSWLMAKNEMIWWWFGELWLWIECWYWLIDDYWRVHRVICVYGLLYSIYLSIDVSHGWLMVQWWLLDC